MFRFGGSGSTTKRSRPEGAERAGGPLAEDAPQLAVSLQAALSGAQRVVVLTGPIPRQGVSTVTRQLGQALARMGEGQVLVLDANFASSGLGARATPDAPADQGVGLSDVLLNDVTLEDAIRPYGAGNLSLLQAGRAPDDPLSLFLGGDYEQLVTRLRNSFRFVVVDAPPILRNPESLVIASRSDGVVLVLTLGESTRTQVREVQRTLDASRIPFFGTVLRQKGKS